MVHPMVTVTEVRDGDTPLAVVMRGGLPDTTQFFTQDAWPLQVGSIAYPTGKDIPRHVHLPVRREVHVTAEFLMVRRGSCVMDVYTADRRLLQTVPLQQGDMVLLMGGGHGFRDTVDLVLLEVKQGPYTGLTEKERF